MDHTENRYDQVMLDVEEVKLENIRLRQVAIIKLNDLSIQVDQMGADIQRNTTNVAVISKDLQEKIKLLEDITEVQLRNSELNNALFVARSRHNEKIIDNLRNQLLEEQNKNTYYMKQNDQLCQDIMSRRTLVLPTVNNSTTEIGAPSGAECHAETISDPHDSHAEVADGVELPKSPGRIAGGRGGSYCGPTSVSCCPVGVSGCYVGGSCYPTYNCGNYGGLFCCPTGVNCDNGYACGYPYRGCTRISPYENCNTGYPCRARACSPGYSCGGRAGVSGASTRITRVPSSTWENCAVFGSPACRGRTANRSKSRPVRTASSAPKSIPADPCAAFGGAANLINFLKKSCVGPAGTDLDLPAIIACLGNRYSPAGVTCANPPAGASSAGVSGRPSAVVNSCPAKCGRSGDRAKAASSRKCIYASRPHSRRSHHLCRVRTPGGRKCPYSRRSKVSVDPRCHRSDPIEMTGPSKAAIVDAPAIAVEPKESVCTAELVSTDVSCNCSRFKCSSDCSSENSAAVAVGSAKVSSCPKNPCGPNTAGVSRDVSTDASWNCSRFKCSSDCSSENSAAVAVGSAKVSSCPKNPCGPNTAGVSRDVSTDASWNCSRFKCCSDGSSDNSAAVAVGRAKISFCPENPCGPNTAGVSRDVSTDVSCNCSRCRCCSDCSSENSAAVAVGRAKISFCPENPCGPNTAGVSQDVSTDVSCNCSRFRCCRDFSSENSVAVAVGRAKISFCPENPCGPNTAGVSRDVSTDVSCNCSRCRCCSDCSVENSAAVAVGRAKISFCPENPCGPNTAGVFREDKAASQSSKCSNSEPFGAPKAQHFGDQALDILCDRPCKHGRFDSIAGKAISVALRDKLDSDVDELLEKEVLDIFNTFVKECSPCFCTYGFPKSKLYLLCHKILQHGIQSILYGELVYMHRQILMAAEKLNPGCLLEIWLTEAGLNDGDMLKRCKRASSLRCSNSEEMLKEKVRELDGDIELAKLYLDFLEKNPQCLLNSSCNTYGCDADMHYR